MEWWLITPWISFGWQTKGFWKGPTTNPWPTCFTYLQAMIKVNVTKTYAWIIHEWHLGHVWALIPFNMLTWHTRTHYVQFLDASFCISIAFPCPPYAEIKNHMIQWPQPDSGFAPGLWISVNPPRDGQRHESTRGFPLYLGLGLGIFPRQLTVRLLVNQVRPGKEKNNNKNGKNSRTAAIRTRTSRTRTRLVSAGLRDTGMARDSQPLRLCHV